MSQDPLPEDFNGVVRLFPLPNLVLFPHAAQPLHLFEPRYRQLMADALADDRLITMALLRPGWEEDYHKEPPIHDMVCLGLIHHEERLEDGRYTLLLQGLSRARIVEELSTDRLYRTARVEPCHDRPVASADEARSLRRRLGQKVRPFFSTHPAALERLDGLLDGTLPLGALCDVFSFALPLDVELKQQLLDECDTRRRVLLLLEGVEGKAPRRPFPPGFSPN